MRNGKRRKRKSFRLPLYAAAFLLLWAGLGLAVTNGKRSYPQVEISGLPVGRLTEEEILDRLTDSGYRARSEQPLLVRSFGGATVEIDPVGAGAMTDAGSAAAAAIRCGREGNVFANLLSYGKCLLQKTEVNAETAMRSDYVSERIAALQRAVDAVFSEDSFVLNEEARTLTIAKGYEKSLSLDAEALTAAIAAAFDVGQSELAFYACAGAPEKPDFAGLYERLCTGPKDACFAEDGSHTVIEGRPGYRFDIGELDALWEQAAPGEAVTVPLSLEAPTVTAEQLESRLYHDLLGAMTTKYNNSGENRCSNVRLASSLVNGTVLFPGEEFSFNRVVGKRTAEAGFLMAPAYAGYDDIQEEIGGGVCQVSTGVYAAAMYAFLDITAHTCHVYPPNYIQLGCDATVSIPASGREIDLKFVNSKSFPIKIVSYCEETVNEETGKPLRTVTVELWGTLEDDDLMPVEFDNRYGDIYDYDRVIEPPYEGRQGYRLLFTHDETEFEDDTGKGLRTLTYIRIYDTEGNLVDKKLMNREYSFGYGMDTYYYMK